MAKLTIDNFTLRANLGHLIRRTHQRVAALYAIEIGRDLPSPQFSVLLTVYQNPGLAQIGLINRIGIDRSTISSLVQRLVKRGMLTRKRVAGNQRTDKLFITERGIAAVEAAIPGAVRVHKRVTEIVPRRLLPSFLEALKTLADWPTANGNGPLPEKKEATAGSRSKPNGASRTGRKRRVDHAAQSR
ncbi:MAG: MarR family transcriptional regulator [Rhodospirillaceae bacterium]|nr:MarR family transcriptional regulator [Rhodospirillaceae bacterium]